MAKTKTNPAKSVRRVRPRPDLPDEDSPEFTAEMFEKTRPIMAVMPEVVEAMKRARGRPKSERPKARVSLRLDQDVLEAFRATGDGWQIRMQDALKRASKRLPPAE